MHFYTAVLLVLLVLQISLGTVSNIEEAVQWLSYTFLYIRMRSNPLVYGIRQDYWEVRKDSDHNKAVLYYTAVLTYNLSA